MWWQNRRAGGSTYAAASEVVLVHSLRRQHRRNRCGDVCVSYYFVYFSLYRKVGFSHARAPRAFLWPVEASLRAPGSLIINTQLPGTTHERPTQFLPAAIMGRQTGHSSNMLLIR